MRVTCRASIALVTATRSPARTENALRTHKQRAAPHQPRTTVIHSGLRASNRLGGVNARVRLVHQGFPDNKPEMAQALH
ncbi:hypothetical protein D7S86_11980 [Pararobbsia silviterrae]|uniref:Uncharacterized protein n=1 Tax=Pararobbsia silviterrae TaxID=1792498 RepID=A0A494Y386_9BURK|nr:hypothetical protein D7S86_11980 [Pararobbsia silviterrae]